MHLREILFEVIEIVPALMTSDNWHRIRSCIFLETVEEFIRFCIFFSLDSVDVLDYFMDGKILKINAIRDVGGRHGN